MEKTGEKNSHEIHLFGIISHKVLLNRSGVIKNCKKIILLKLTKSEK